MSSPPTMAIGTSSSSRTAIRCGQGAAPSGGGPAHMPSIDRQVDLCGLEWLGGRGCGDWEEPVDLAGHIALEAADDLALGQALSGAAFHIGDGGRMPAHPDDDDPEQRGVGLAVAAPVEAVTAGLAGGGRDGAGAAQLGGGSLRADPTGVVARGTEQLGGAVEPDPEGGDQLGGGPGVSVLRWRVWA